MITREADYALRALLCLAGEAPDEGRQVPTSALAARLDIPYRFLRGIMRRLTAAGLVVSGRGKGGGLRLGRSAARLSVLDVLRAVDPGGVTLNRCVADPASCRHVPRCVLHPALVRLQRRLEADMGRVRLADVARGSGSSAGRQRATTNKKGS